MQIKKKKSYLNRVMLFISDTYVHDPSTYADSMFIEGVER